MNASTNSMRLLIGIAIAAVILIAVTVISRTEKHTHAEQAAIPTPTDSIARYCNRASALMHEAMQSDIYADIPGDNYLQAMELVDSALSLCRLYRLPSALPDSLNAELRPRLEATRRAVEARLKVVEGIRYAEQPLLRQLNAIDSVLSLN